MAKLEFALSVAVAAAVAGLALSALSGMQALGNEARRVTLATEQAAASAVNEARCRLPRAATALPVVCESCPSTFTASPQTGSASSVTTVPACPPPPPSSGVLP